MSERSLLLLVLLLALQLLLLTGGRATLGPDSSSPERQARLRRGLFKSLLATTAASLVALVWLDRLDLLWRLPMEFARVLPFGLHGYWLAYRALALGLLIVVAIVQAGPRRARRAEAEALVPRTDGLAFLPTAAPPSPPGTDRAALFPGSTGTEAERARAATQGFVREALGATMVREAPGVRTYLWNVRRRVAGPGAQGRRACPTSPTPSWQASSRRSGRSASSATG